jgi:iron complex outermembrane recepter protein
MIRTTPAPHSRGLWHSHAVLVTLAAVSTALGQTTPPNQTGATDDDEVIQLSAFTVSTERDVGYRASNSIAGTRTNTPIKDIPMNIQVFTKDLADDLLIKNQVDFENYNASLVNGNADRFSDNVIQQSYQNFLFRGFRQNWGLRDGVREYDPIDTQNLARVEVVKGPAAALYGLAYPGGVMQNITKSVDFNREFTSLRFTVGDQGDYRATIDANYTGEKGTQRFGVRFNGVHERTEDERAHSRGSVELAALLLEWRPTRSTQIEFLMEQGERKIPNGLGYFSAGNEAGAPGNRSDIPLQIIHPEIPWDWNWSNGRNYQSLEVSMYRGTVTQSLGDNFSVRGYWQFSKRLNITSDGWDANGSGGADSWEHADSGWDRTTNTIRSTYHYRDWGNGMHAYGATGVYKLDTSWAKNTFAFGANVWAEDELSRASRPLNPRASSVVYPVQAGIPIPVPTFPPPDLVPEIDGGPNGNGYHHENNSNDYYFVSWQAAWLENRLKTNVGINRTNMKLQAWNNGASFQPDNVYTASKNSPLYGVIFDVTKEISVFALHATSLFPDTTKDSFGNQFSPQVGESWEGGLKVELMDGRISGTLSIFEITQTGGSQSAPNRENANTARWDRLTPEQRAIEFPGRTRADLFAAGDIIEGGEQRSRGVELDLVFQPMRELQIVTSFAHVDHEFVTSAVPSTIGQTYPFAVKTRASILGKYTFLNGPVKGLSLGMGAFANSKQLIDYQTWNGVDVARYEPSRFQAEAFAAYRFRLFDQSALVQLNLRNITREPHYVGWKATGSSNVLATERYEVPTPVVVRLTFGVDF